MPKSVLDERLAEIDSRLKSIQSGLVESQPRVEPSRPVAPISRALPVRVELASPVEQAPPAPASPPWAAELTAQLRGLSEQLAVLSGPSAAKLAVVAGPLANTGALHEFEHALAALPGVRTVELRGFEGGDRAILDVDLQPNP
jgi:hypothetical protein